MTRQQLIELINELVKQPHESEWVEFKLNFLRRIKKSILRKAGSWQLTADARIYEIEPEGLMIAAEPEVRYERTRKTAVKK